MSATYLMMQDILNHLFSPIEFVLICVGFFLFQSVTTLLILCWSPSWQLRPDEEWPPQDHWGCCNIWNQDVSSRSVTCWKLCDAVYMDRTRLSSTSDKSSIRSITEEFGGQINIWNTLSCSSKHSLTVFAVWPGSLSCRARPRVKVTFN